MGAERSSGIESASSYRRSVMFAARAVATSSGTPAAGLAVCAAAAVTDPSHMVNPNKCRIAFPSFKPQAPSRYSMATGPDSRASD